MRNNFFVMIKQACKITTFPCSSEENIERANMIKSLVRVKEVVGETAKQFNLSQKEVLRMASDQG